MNAQRIKGVRLRKKKVPQNPIKPFGRGLAGGNGSSYFYENAKQKSYNENNSINAKIIDNKNEKQADGKYKN